MKKPGRQLIGVATTIALLLLLFFSWRRGDTEAPAPVPGVAAPTVQGSNTPAAALQRYNASTTLPASPFSAFNSWAKEYASAATPAAKAALLAEGETLAQARHDAMLKLIKSDPQQALQSAVPYAL